MAVTYATQNILVYNHGNQRTLVCWGRKKFVDYDTGERYNKILLRDPRDLCFMLGLPEAPSIELLVALVRSVAAEHLPGTSLVSVGYSGGGYPAIVYGCQLPASRILACAPPSALDMSALQDNVLLRNRVLSSREQQGDFTTRGLIESLQASLPLDLVDYDICVPCTVYYPTCNDVDSANAKRLAGKPAVRLVGVDGGDHFELKRAFDEILCREQV